VDAPVEMHVGDAGDPEAVELVREAGDGDVVPRDVDRDGLDEKPVAQRGGGDGAGGSDEESATGEGKRHGGKVTSPPNPLSTLASPPNPLSTFVERGDERDRRKRVLGD